MAGASAPAPPFRLDLRRLTAADRTVGGASLLTLIALFLPWFGFSAPGLNDSESGLSAHGYLFIVLITGLAIAGYLAMRAGWAVPPVKLPVAYAPLLLVGTGLQMLIVVIGFLSRPAGLSWEAGAYLALIGAVAAGVPIGLPAVRWWLANR